MYFVYMLLCGDRTLYTGITTDIKRRLAEHKEGKGGRYTRAREISRLLYSETQPTRSAALKREAAIKKLTRREKLALAKQKL